MNTLNNKVDLFSIVNIPFNYSPNARKIFDWFRQDSIRRYKIIFDKECNDNHFDLKQINEYYPNIRTIALIINPWDRIFQTFIMLRRQGKINQSFEYFVFNIEEFDLGSDILKNQVDYVQYIDNTSTMTVDFIIRNEHFGEDFKKLQDYFSTNDRLTEQKPLPAYKTVYNEKTIKRVGEMFERDVDYFGYKF